ncbi:hypothetical protein CFP65_3277 [Kitasatospora sp. MMS16-BH015]|uniref:helix-turn-helix domain-containing protein n=1 Tax=Kitasatospora sp. MMS16-BH015 TaxID=2018025 RepID=UPI000CA24160|nr:helix-turn-helix domain-containing protein [Kitasatospora sp. MMS16-BH015]AUG78078.1 hypothetical protein CFP65_3277 [Kitasatospora sp. MMS16-BH015]
MSHSARDWVWERSRTRGTARLVLLSLADHVTGPECLAYGSTRSLAGRTGAGERTVVTAVDRAVALGELEVVAGRRGPRGERVYRLPHAVGWVPGAAGQAEPDSPEQPGEGCGNGTGGGAETAGQGCENGMSGGAETAPGASGACKSCTPGGAETAGRGCENCMGGGAVSAPQNLSEQKGTVEEQEQRAGAREASASAAARFALPVGWEPDDALIGWAAVTGHLQRLGVEGIDRATAKWLTHRAAAPARTAEQWRADWRQWIARERTGPQLRAVPDGASTGTGTRAGRNAQLLQAALAELNAQGGQA